MGRTMPLVVILHGFAIPIQGYQTDHGDQSHPKVKIVFSKGSFIVPNMACVLAMLHV
jgi:hypothetical protein